MTYSLGISNFLEELSSLSHSIVFLDFFALITEEGFLFFLNNFIHFNWRLITLQYCSGFAIHCHESTPVFLSEESHGQRSRRAIDHGVAKELDMT